MSQLSDIYPSSHFDSQDRVPYSALHFLLPEDSLSQRESQSQSRSQYQSESQFGSVPDLLSPQSHITPLAPDTLTRIKPDRINEFIICTPEMTKEFVVWWLKTGYGRSKQNLNWDTSPTKRRADCWKGFQQVANTKDGKPGVMCKRCRTVLAHPATNHTGTSTMQKHLDGPRCRQRVPKQALQGTSSIHRLLSDAVCLSIFLVEY
jgi:hypothetical protein